MNKCPDWHLPTDYKPTDTGDVCRPAYVPHVPVWDVFMRWRRMSQSRGLHLRQFLIQAKDNDGAGKLLLSYNAASNITTSQQTFREI